MTKVTTVKNSFRNESSKSSEKEVKIINPDDLETSTSRSLQTYTENGESTLIILKKNAALVTYVVLICTTEKLYTSEKE